MRPNLELLKADIRDELEKIARLKEAFAELEGMLAKPPEEVPFYDRAAIGYYLHSFYNGCENIFRTVGCRISSMCNDSRDARETIARRPSS